MDTLNTNKMEVEVIDSDILIHFTPKDVFNQLLNLQSTKNKRYGIIDDVEWLTIGNTTFFKERQNGS